MHPSPHENKPGTLLEAAAESGRSDSRDHAAGPFSAAALTRRALADLADIAAVMHQRQRHPDDILDALARQAALWGRQGAHIDEHDVLNAVRAVAPNVQPYADLEHSLMRDRIHRAIAAMQTEIAGKAYRDGYLDAVALAEERTTELVREIMAHELPDALRALGIHIGRRACG